jgi:hypothetical protein
MMREQPGRARIGSFVGVFLLLGMGSSLAQAPAAGANPVTFTVTAISSADKVPTVALGDVQLSVGRNSTPVTRWERDENLALAILIDESIDRGAASNWPDLRKFIMELPATALVAVGYLGNNVTTLAQDFTTNHEAAANALRIPNGGTRVSSPYIATLSLLTRWPTGGPRRRAVILISSGIDFFRGPLGGAMLWPDVDPLVQRAQAQNTNIWAIFFPASSRPGANMARPTPGPASRSMTGTTANPGRSRTATARDGQNNLGRLTDGTGGDLFALGIGRPVSLRPAFDEIFQNLNNQYLLTFEAPKGTTGRTRVDVTTELEDVTLMAPSEVNLPGAR